jgi:hypothetical protein
VRPPLASRRTLDLPRWRRRLAADLRSLAFGYGVALAVCVVLLAAICFTPGGLARRGPDFTAAVLAVFAVAAYLAIGGSVVALMVRRLAHWHGRLPGSLARSDWILVMLWPVAVAALLLKAALRPSV